jgi:hypothetical protein
MQPDARAVLTLGSRMCKDKLMQAAGRMRLLDKGQQSVTLLAMPEIDQRLRETNALRPHTHVTAAHVVQWTLINTASAVAPEGLVEWGSQGVDFAHTHASPAAAVRPEVAGLRELYARSLASQPVPVVVKGKAAAWSKEDGAAPLEGVLNRVLDRVGTLGAGYAIASTGHDEECERELEQEVEEEQEVEREVREETPRSEEDWEYSTALAQQRGSLKFTIATTNLGSFVATRLRTISGLTSVDWGAGGAILATANFLETTTPPAASLTRFLRPVDALLVFPDQGVLLLSDREADAILELMQGRPSSSPPFLVHLSYVRLSLVDPARLKARGMTTTPGLPVATLVALQLFAGETAFATGEQQAALRRMLPDPKARNAALQLPGLRGLHLKVYRSDLERACKA